MSNDLLKKLDGVLGKLSNVEKIVKDQEKEIRELRKFYQVTYETARKHKELNDKYKKTCGPLSSKESTGGNNGRGEINSKSKIPEVG